MYPRCNLTVLHVQTLRSLRYYYQGLVDKMEKESGQSTRCKRTHIHTREGGGIDSQKVEDLMRNWTLQSPLNLGTMEAKKILGWGVEDITAKELEAEFNRLRLRTSDSQGATRYLGPRQHPTRLPDILGGEIHRLVVSREKIDRFFFSFASLPPTANSWQNPPETAICLAVVSASNCPQHYQQTSVST